MLQERDGYPSVAVRCAAVRDRALRALSKVRRRSRSTIEPGISFIAAQEQARREAESAGFEDLETAQEWVLPEAELAELEATVRAWDSRLQTIHVQLSSPSVLAVAGLTATTAERWARPRPRMSCGRPPPGRGPPPRGHISAARHGVSRWPMAAVAEAAQDRVRRAADSADLDAVDAYVRGQAGSPRMTLSTFVLRYWFEQVVAAANVRLATMSAGSSSCCASSRARGPVAVGLGLAILDRHTGRERGTETLSGGESFYTSLSLALGLADVVVAEADGAALDTLFIDEGFGTLDTTTLDEVMAVIDELRGHGRLVGVVSHVAELKERIPERLSIRRARPDGPSTIDRGGLSGRRADGGCAGRAACPAYAVLRYAWAGSPGGHRHSRPNRDSRTKGLPPAGECSCISRVFVRVGRR